MVVGRQIGRKKCLWRDSIQPSLNEPYSIALATELSLFTLIFRALSPGIIYITQIISVRTILFKRWWSNSYIDLLPLEWGLLIIILQHSSKSLKVTCSIVKKIIRRNLSEIRLVHKSEFHTWYLSRTPRTYSCKFFLAGVIFFRFNRKIWQFTVYFAVITQKIGNLLCILS